MFVLYSTYPEGHLKPCQNSKMHVTSECNATWDAGVDRHALHWLAPLICRGDGAGVRREAQVEHLRALTCASVQSRSLVCLVRCKVYQLDSRVVPHSRNNTTNCVMLSHQVCKSESLAQACSTSD